MTFVGSREYYVEDGVNGTLQANGSGGSRIDKQPLYAQDGVRRLTPVECERLQSFPDDWTLVGKTADSRRYAAVGDAVTVNVAEWLGRRLAVHEQAA